jgi:hypothetical protein
MIDEFLHPNANLDRLKREYKENGTLVIAYDFDNTVHDYSQKGHTYEMVIKLLRELKQQNFTLLCFTANPDIGFVRHFCNVYDIPIDHLNDCCPRFPSLTRKIFYHAFLDDRAGLIQMYTELRELLYWIRDKQQ